MVPRGYRAPVAHVAGPADGWGSEAEGRGRGARRWARPVLAGALVVLAVLLVLTAARLRAETYWYESVGHGGVPEVVLRARVLLGTAGAALAAVLVGGSLWLARRTAPRFAAVTPAERALAEYRALVRPSRGWTVAGAVLGSAVLCGNGASGQWATYLLWRHRRPVGVTEPVTGADIGFFLFTLPALQALLGYLTLVLVLALIVAMAAQYAVGGLTVPGRRPPTRAALAHVGGLAALLLLVRAGQAWLSRYEAVLVDRGPYVGADAAAASSGMALHAILGVAAAVCAGLFLSAAWSRALRPALVGTVCLVVTSVVVGGLVPAAARAFGSRPDPEQDRAALERSLVATRAAWGLDGIERVDAPATLTGSGDASRIAAAAPRVDRLTAASSASARDLADGMVLPDALDPVTVPGEGELYLGLREADTSAAVAGTWDETHLRRTHGWGIVVVPTRPAGSAPIESLDTSATGVLGRVEPRSYVGEAASTWVVTGVDGVEEHDGPALEDRSRYDGLDGIVLSSATRRAVLGLALGDWRLAFDDRIGERSRLLMHRRPLERVARVAPWLTLDGDPYPVVAGGRVLWVVDGYTTSSRYPGSERLDLSTASADAVSEASRSTGTVRRGQASYVRRSVVATVDAYDGTTTLYRTDEADPLVAAWDEAFPGTLRDRRTMPDAVAAALRYPRGLFALQRRVLARYADDDPTALASPDSGWRVPGSAAEADVARAPVDLVRDVPGSRRVETVRSGELVDASRSSATAILEATSAGTRSDRPGELVLRELGDEQSSVPSAGRSEDAIARSSDLGQGADAGATLDTILRAPGEDGVTPVVTRHPVALVPGDETVVALGSLTEPAPGGGSRLRGVVAARGDTVAWGRDPAAVVRAVLPRPAPAGGSELRAALDRITRASAAERSARRSGTPGEAARARRQLDDAIDDASRLADRGRGR